MKAVIRVGLMLMMALLLAACGGGGGGGGGNAGAEPATVRSVTLRGAEQPVQRSAIQALDVKGFTLAEEIYTADVDGAAVNLAKASDTELVFFLPIDLEAGQHQLNFSLDGRSWSFPFEVMDYVILDRATAESKLDVLFQKYRTALNDLIAVMTANGVSQVAIDDLLVRMESLDTQSDEFALLTDNEVDFLLGLFESFEDDAQSKSSAYGFHTGTIDKSLLGDAYSVIACHENKVFVSGLVRMVAFGGLTVGTTYGSIKLAAGSGGTLWLPATIGFVASVGLAGITATYAVDLVPNLENAIKECWEASGAELVEELQGAKSSRAAIPKNSQYPVLDAAGELDFETAVSGAYRLGIEKYVPGDVLPYLPKLKRVIADMSLLFSSEEQQLISQVVGDEYKEFAGSSSLSLEGISDPQITGDITALDDEMFSLSFSSEQPVSETVDFTFLIRDDIHEVKTRFQATLTATQHCPFLVSGGHDIVPMADKCIIIQHPNGDPAPIYQEYQYGAVILTEMFESGSVDLKNLKGLDAYDQVGSYGVSTPIYWHEESTLFSDGEGNYYSVPSYFEANVSGVREEMDYSAPYLDQFGSWSSSPLQQRTYYPNGDYQQYDYEVVEGWGSVFKYDLWSSASGSREIFYTSPLEAGSGWTSVDDYRLDYSGGLGSSLISKEEYTTISVGSGWSYYLSRMDDYVNDCYITYSQEGDILTDTCNPPVE